MRSHWSIPAAVLIIGAGCSTTDTPLAEVPVITPRKGCGPTLVHDHDWYESGKVQPLFRGHDVVRFPISVPNDLPASRRDSVQRYFDQGLLLAYGFNHAEAARSFWQATRLDSTCAMAWWGFAYVLGPNYNAGMEPDNYERAYAAITRAKELKADITPKEAALIDAMAMRYGPEVTEDRSAFDEAYSEALRGVAETYPDDPDVATLFAESLMDQHPWDLWEKNGTAKPWTPEIVATLERGLARFPTHPGAHHLYIHAVEASRTPDRALPSAEFLVDAVPVSGHLTHMPSHIFIRTGRYHDGVLANQRSVSIDSGYTALCHAQGVYPLAYFPHNIHFLSACATMSGERELAWRSALRLRQQLAKDLLHEPDWSTLQHYHSYPLAVAVKLGMWERLAYEAEPDSGLHHGQAMWHYAQGIRLARAGAIPAAREQLAGLRTMKEHPDVQELTIWGINRVVDVLTIAELVLEGEVRAAEGDLEGAIGSLTAAVEAEDALQYQEPPDWSFPARHELGAVLLKAGKAKEAEEVYRADLVFWPENGYALGGLRSALIAQGDTAAAKELQARIDQAWYHADNEAGPTAGN